MTFPPPVLEVKEQLRIASMNFLEKKPLYEAICKLTEMPAMREDDIPPVSIADLEDMWASLQSHSEQVDMEDAHWVRSFLQAAAKYSQLPAFYYRSKKENTALLQEIKKLSSQLIELYEGNDLDAQIILNNANLLAINAKSELPGFYIYEDLFDVEKNMAGSSEFVDEKKSEDFVFFTQTVNAFANRAEALMESAIAQRGNMSNNVHAIRFVRNFGRYVRNTYDTPLNKVVSIVTYALYGVFYEQSDIRNLQNR